MENWDIQVAWHYHNGTKHPYGNLMDPGHFFDYSMQPLLFKIYPGLDPIPLLLDKTPAGMPALDALSALPRPARTGNRTPMGHGATGDYENDRRAPDLGVLARILFFSAGITRRIQYPGYGEVFFRAAACTGALYHIELYLVCGNLPGGDSPALEAGVYHFDPSQTALRLLRRGDFRPALAAAGGGELALAQSPAILVYTDVFFRNAVKYQAREYRHAFWDSGTILANTLAMASAHDLPARVALGFVDEQVNRLLDLDGRREAALALVALGFQTGEGQEALPEIAPLSLEVRQISEQEIVFPAILDIHRASSLNDSREVVAWREGAAQNFPATSVAVSKEEQISLRPFNEDEIAKDPIEKVIVRRGSTRRFAREPVSFQQLSTLLERTTRGVPADFLPSLGASLNDIYLIVNEVDGLEAGTYFFNREQRALERLKAGLFRREAGGLALGQALAADASVNVYFMTNLDQVLERLGNRGYRAAQMEASILAGKMYLAAYAQRIGATGLTFYDDAVAGFFSPHASGKSVMFLIALGIPAKKQMSFRMVS